jgi:hypothetical protein
MRVPSPFRSFGLAGSLLLLASSCSLLYDLSPDQCGTNADCAHFGAGYRCEAGICKGSGVVGTGGSGGTATGGRPTTSGGSGAMTNTGGGSTIEGGASTGGTEPGNGGTGGTSPTGGRPTTTGGSGPTIEGGAGGEGGTPFVPECSTHKDCFDKNGSLDPQACVDGLCVNLKSDECPVLLPLSDTNYEALTSTDAIILGAFSYIPSSLVGNYTRNYDLAVTEFNEEAGGLFVGGKRRKIAMVVCNWTYDMQSDFLKPTEHLVNELKVPAVLGPVLADDQQYVFEEKGSEAGVFFMSPGYSHDSLATLQDGGLVWNMLSGGSALSVSYTPLLDLAVTHLRHQTTANHLGETDDVRVAVITATDERFLRELSDSVKAQIKFNGKTAAENETDGNFKAIATTSYYKDPNFSQVAVRDAMLAFKPHIIIGMTGDEMFTKIIPLIETDWSTSVPDQPPPFYMLSPFHYQNAQLTAFLNSNGATRTRLIGVNWPAAADQTVYNAYQGRFNEKYGSLARGLENYYDSAYYLLYATAAAGQLISGDRIAQGMLRITSGATQYSVGPNDMNMALQVLQNGTGKFTLIGAGGPPTWDTNGSRNDPGSVWCINSAKQCVPDVMRYDTTNKTLSGTPPCFTFPAPAP